MEACDIVTVTDKTALRSLFQTCDTQDDKADRHEYSYLVILSMTHLMLDGVGYVENSESRSHVQHSNWCRLTCSNPIHSNSFKNSSFFSVKLKFHIFFFCRLKYENRLGYA